MAEQVPCDLRHAGARASRASNCKDPVPVRGQASPDPGAPSFPHITCSNGPSGDMFMNYMDYVDDRVMVMFTHGQVARMQAALAGPRNTIGA